MELLYLSGTASIVSCYDFLSWIVSRTWQFNQILWSERDFLHIQSEDFIIMYWQIFTFCISLHCWHNCVVLRLSWCHRNDLCLVSGIRCQRPLAEPLKCPAWRYPGCIPRMDYSKLQSRSKRLWRSSKLNNCTVDCSFAFILHTGGYTYAR